MALTRSMLRGMGLTEEQVGAIIEEHTNVTDALKEQRDSYKQEAEKLPDIQKELEELKKSVESSGSSASEWEKKYKKEHDDFEKYKLEITEKETTEKIKSAYKKLLAECKVGDKHVDSIIRVTDFTDMKLGEDGNLENADSLKEKISSDWSGFISSNGTRGANVDNPPGGTGNDGDGGGTSRAAQLAAKYHENLYGKTKEV